MTIASTFQQPLTELANAQEFGRIQESSMTVEQKAQAVVDGASAAEAAATVVLKLHSKK